MDISQVVQTFQRQYAGKIRTLGCQFSVQYKLCKDGEQGAGVLEVTVPSDAPIPKHIKEQIENSILPWIYDWQGKLFSVKVQYSVAK